MMYVWLAVAIALAVWHGVFTRRLRAALEHISAKLDVALAAHGVPSVDLYGKHSRKYLWVTELASVVQAKADRLAKQGRSP